jgi:ATP-dependent DNA ligase
MVAPPAFFWQVQGVRSIWPALSSAGRLEVVSPPPLAQRIAIGLMHPTQVAAPFHREGWVYEEKVDGYRMAAMKAGDGTRLISRNGIQHTKRFPGLVQALDSLSPEAFLLDGEVAVYDPAFISRFEWLRGRPKDALTTEPVYMVFDLLGLGGKDLRGRSGSGGICKRDW